VYCLALICACLETLSRATTIIIHDIIRARSVPDRSLRGADSRLLFAARGARIKRERPASRRKTRRINPASCAAQQRDVTSGQSKAINAPPLRDRPFKAPFTRAAPRLRLVAESSRLIEHNFVTQWGESGLARTRVSRNQRGLGREEKSRHRTLTGRLNICLCSEPRQLARMVGEGKRKY